VLTHADSRLWRTVWPLLARPGFLTREYFAGHRARYLQPFRLYLIMSVLFFVLSAVLTGGSGSASTLTVNDAQAIRREGTAVGAVSYLIRQSGQVEFGNQNWTTQSPSADLVASNYRLVFSCNR